MRRFSMHMTRSFADNLGLQWPREVACVVDGEPVTWKEVHANRAERMRRKLDWKRRPAQRPRVAAWVWVFYNPHWIYQGWYCYLNWFENGRVMDMAVNFKGFHHGLAASLMREFPSGLLPIGSPRDQFEEWMVEFVKRFPRKKTRKDRRKAGSAFVWLDLETMTVEKIRQ